MSEHILIVDDQPELAGLMADLLHDAGYATRVAGNGREALHEVQLDRPNLLLLDAQMPELDGFEVATMLKAIRPPRPSRSSWSPPTKAAARDWSAWKAAPRTT